jgi:hypothetical protein
MVLLAKPTDRELARMVSYLKEENRILRARLPEQINTTPKERQRLLRFGRNLGNAICSVVPNKCRWLRLRQVSRWRRPRLLARDLLYLAGHIHI